MKVLVLGGGGREHALTWRLSRDPAVTELHCAPGNPGMAELAAVHPVEPGDPAAVTQLAAELDADLVVVGPEAPLATGVVDALTAAGIAAFGPTKAAAQIETSKAFAKELMGRAGIPTAAHGVFDSYPAAAAFIRRHGGPLVVKADGLYAGKGVVVAPTTAAALDAAERMLVAGEFGAAGRRVVVEEYLTGQELSVIAVCDGERALVLPPCQDHKAAYDGDQGPNTGGMGAYCPVPFVGPDFADQVAAEVLMPALGALATAGSPFRGALYAGLMLTEDGLRALEFNARFGDPEVQALLVRWQGPFAAILYAAARGRLAAAVQAPVAWDERAAACVVLASPGYPGTYPKGIPLGGVAAAGALTDDSGGEVVVFHAGTARTASGDLVTSGGRVLGVTALGAGLPAAVDLAYRAAARIDFPRAHMRRDIGRRAAPRG